VTKYGRKIKKQLPYKKI